MVKSVTIINHLGESIKLELGFPEKSGFSVLGIEGLGPCKADINSTEVATNDGSLFNSARVNSRNIVIKLGFLYNPTIEDTRQLSYKYFPIKKRICLIFETDSRSCFIYGYVESNEPDIFSANEGTQISVVCPDPYFYSLEEGSIVFSGVESDFEFEFCNDSLTDDTIEMGEIKNYTSQTIEYSGDTENGIQITVHALGDVTNITIYNTDTREVMAISTDKIQAMTGSGISIGDDIIISTVKGNKYIMLLRGGTYINILNCLDKNADWFQLAKGSNTFAYTAQTGVQNLEFIVTNQTLYEGI